MFLREDDIVEEGRRQRLSRTGMILECGRDEKEGGGTLIQRRAAGALAAINAGTDGHAAMQDETLRCTAWEARQTVNNVA
jgi:hypothetical protein